MESTIKNSKTNRRSLLKGSWQRNARSKRSRLRLSRLAGVYLAGLALLATFLKLENIAMASIGGLMTILSAYLWAETKRPSVKP
jgi:hypothetical protein